MKSRPQTVLLAILLGILCAASSFSQKRASSVLRPFEPLEMLVYDAEFSRALLRKVDVADFRLSASRPSLLRKAADNSRTVPDDLILTCDVVSKGFFAKLFGLKFRETLESTADPVSLAVHTSKRVDEQGKRMRSSEAGLTSQTQRSCVWGRAARVRIQLPPQRPAPIMPTVVMEFCSFFVL